MSEINNEAIVISDDESQRRPAKKPRRVAKEGGANKHQRYYANNAPAIEARRSWKTIVRNGQKAYSAKMKKPIIKVFFKTFLDELAEEVRGDKKYERYWPKHVLAYTVWHLMEHRLLTAYGSMKKDPGQLKDQYVDDSQIRLGRAKWLLRPQSTPAGFKDLFQHMNNAELLFQLLEKHKTTYHKLFEVFSAFADLEMPPKKPSKK